MVELAWMYCASGISPVAHILSPSSILKGTSEGVGSASTSSSSSVSSTVVGKELERQALMLAASRLQYLSFFPRFSLAPVATPRRAAGHLYLPGPPVYFRIVVFQPRVTQDKVLLSEASDAEQGSFGVAVVT